MILLQSGLSEAHKILDRRDGLKIFKIKLKLTIKNANNVRCGFAGTDKQSS